MTRKGISSSVAGLAFARGDAAAAASAQSPDAMVVMYSLLGRDVWCLGPASPSASAVILATFCSTARAGRAFKRERRT